MREIKFRFFCNGKMHYPKLIGLMWGLDDNPAVYETVDGMEHVPHYKDGNLMQFTGLHDKNGKEIYEGDIVRRTCDLIMAEDDFTGTVIYECAAFMLDNPGENEGRYLWDDIQELEVLGNVYENPELLEVQK